MDSASGKRVEQESIVSVLPEEILEAIFGYLTTLEKARVAGVCRLFRDVSYRPCLWRSVDTWGLGWDRKIASVVSGRCSELEELMARGAVAALACIHLKARKLRKLHLDSCADLSDAALGVLIGRHEGLTSVHLDGATFLTNESVEVIALACPLLESLRVGGFKDCVDKDALSVLFEGCPHIAELSLTDCQMVDEGGLAAAKQLQLLSLAGCKVSSWAMAAEILHKLPNLVGLDVSRTEIYTANTSYLLFNSPRLSLLVALDCPLLDGHLISTRLGSICPRQLAVFTLEGDLSRALASVRSPPSAPDGSGGAGTEPGGSPESPVRLPVVQTRAQALATCFEDFPPQVPPRQWELSDLVPSPPSGNGHLPSGNTVKSVWRSQDGVPEGTLAPEQRRAAEWVECTLVHALQKAAEKKATDLERFWLQHGARALVALLGSEQASVQEKAAVTLADLAIDEADTVTAHVARSTSIYMAGAVRPLLRLARSTVDSLQGEAMKALGNLCVNKRAAELIVESGGIGEFLRAAGSASRWVAEEAAGALWNLSMMDPLKDKIAAAGVLEVLVSLLTRWSKDADVVQERVAGALANMANHEATSYVMVHGECLDVLNRLLRTSSHEGLHEQIVRVLANLAAQGDCNTSNNVAIARVPGCLAALVSLTKGDSAVLQIEAATALWNLAFDEGVREMIAAEGGVHSLVGIAKQCCGGAVYALQERVTGALWGLSASQGNSVLIGEEGGIPPLIQLARSVSEDVQEAAAGVLWNLAFNPGNARTIKLEGGISALTALCASPTSTTLAKFMSVLALSYLCDSQAERDRPYVLRPSDDRKEVFQHINAFVEEHSQHYIGGTVESDLRLKGGPSPKSRPREEQLWKSASVMTWQMTSEASTMREVGDLRCSDFEIERFSIMLRDPYETLQHCAAFALLQFTMPSGRHTPHHVAAMRKAGSQEILSGLLENGAAASVKLRCLAKLILCNMQESDGQ